MVILTGGCSFTAPEHSWAHELGRCAGLPVHNHAEYASGNRLIARNFRYGLSRLLKEHRPKDVAAFIMWSSPNRHELFISQDENPDFADHFPRRQLDPQICNHVERDLGKHPQDYSRFWVKGGGSAERYLSPWTRKPAFRKFKSYYKNEHSFELSFIETLEEILGLQYMLKGLGVPYRMMCWQNIFSQTAEIKRDAQQAPEVLGESETDGIGSGSCSDRSLKGSVRGVELTRGQPLLVEQYAWAQHLWDLIDWSPWWFYEDDRVQKGGLGEWVVQASQAQGDLPFGSHPTPQAHAEFAKKIVFPLLVGMKELEIGKNNHVLESSL